jgi:hypothetical protein
LQAAVARLAVDEPLRERFLDDPASVADALGLSTEEAREVAGRVGGLAPFADSLVRKRLGSVRRLLPKTAERLGPRFGEAFRSFASSNPSRSPHRHERDALALAAILSQEAQGEAREALRIESGWIETALGRRFLVRRLPKGFAVWLRTGRTVRFWKLGGAADWTRPAPVAQESEEGS